MTWLSEVGPDFEILYNKNPELHSLYKYAMALILESNDPRQLPLTISMPVKPNYFMMNLQETHCIIFRIEEQMNTIEFIFCN